MQFGRVKIGEMQVGACKLEGHGLGFLGFTAFAIVNWLPSIDDITCILYVPTGCVCVSEQP